MSEQDGTITRIGQRGTAKDISYGGQVCRHTQTNHP
jgi:hypothetical protein